MEVYLVVCPGDTYSTVVCDSIEVAEWHVKELKNFGITAITIPRFVRTKEDCDE